MNYVEKGQVWAFKSGARFLVESHPDEFNRVSVRDERTGAESRVHTEFFNGKQLVEQRAKIQCEERSFA